MEEDKMLKKIIITIIGFLALTVAYTGAFTVLETEQGVILQDFIGNCLSYKALK
jgi:hypothetical protein